MNGSLLSLKQDPGAISKQYFLEYMAQKNTPGKGAF
jgi:hypothetical protein